MIIDEIRETIGYFVAPSVHICDTGWHPLCAPNLAYAENDLLGHGQGSPAMMDNATSRR